MSEKIPSPSELEGKMQQEMDASSESHKKEKKRKMGLQSTSIESPIQDPVDQFDKEQSLFNNGLPKKKRKDDPDYIFRMSGEFKKDNNGRWIYPKMTIDNMDQVIDPDTGKIRTMRLLRGVDTIWMDEQQHITEKQADNMRPMLTFHEGILRIPPYERNTIEFLKRKNCCANNDFRMRGSKIWYYLEDYEKREREEYEIEKKKFEALTLAHTASDEQMYAHGKFLGIIMMNDSGEEMSPYGIRIEYKKAAEKNPETFINSFYNPHLKMHFLICQKYDEGEIIIDREALKAKWKNAGTICVLPQGKDPLKYLADFAFTENGKYFASMMQNDS